MAGNLVVKCKGLAQRRDRQHNHDDSTKTLFGGVAPTPNALLYPFEIHAAPAPAPAPIISEGGWFQNCFGQNITKYQHPSDHFRRRRKRWNHLSGQWRVTSANSISVAKPRSARRKKIGVSLKTNGVSRLHLNAFGGFVTCHFAKGVY